MRPFDIKSVIFLCSIFAVFQQLEAKIPDNEKVTKIVDYTTETPDANAQYKTFSLYPSISNGVVVFQAYDSNLESGIYSFTKGSLNQIVHQGDKTPVGGILQEVLSVSIDGEVIAYRGISKEQNNKRVDGIYVKTGKDTRVIANSLTTIPDSGSPFNMFFEYSVDQHSVIFRAAGGNKSGIYQYNFKDKTIRSLIDLENKKLSPNSPTQFIEPSLSKGVLVFEGLSQKTDGIYIKTEHQKLKLIADTRTTAPQSSELFSKFYPPSNDGSSLTFLAQHAKESAIYLYRNGRIQEIASTKIATGKKINFTSFDTHPAIFSNKIVFQAMTEDRHKGIYLYNGDTSKISSIINSSETLEGKEIQRFELGKQSMDKNNVVFIVYFSDGNAAIYLAKITDL